MKALSAEHKVTIKDAVIHYDLIRKNIRSPRLEFKKGRLSLIVPPGMRDHEQVIQRHKRWIYNRYSKHQVTRARIKEIKLADDSSIERLQYLVAETIPSFAKELGVTPNTVSFRTMKTKWGSCSSSGKVTLNTHMRFLPEELIRYIVFHEMVHLLVANHGPEFKRYISTRFCEHRSYDEELAAYWLLIHESFENMSGCAEL